MQKKLKVMIFEDEIFTVMMLSDYLRSLGHEILSFSAEAENSLKKADLEEPDVIFMDVQLAGNMDGIEAAKIITEKRDVPIIFLTGYPSEEIINRSGKLKPLAVLLKPVVVEEIKLLLESI